MSIDVQILSSALLKLVQSTIQQTLDTTCVPPLEPIFFDHADVLSVSLSVDQQAGVANFDAPPLRRGACRRELERRRARTLQMLENLGDDGRLLDAGGDLDGPAAALTHGDVDF